MDSIDDQPKVVNMNEARRRKEEDEIDDAELEAAGIPSRLDNDLEAANYFCNRIIGEIKSVPNACKSGWMCFSGRQWETDDVQYMERAKAIARELVARMDIPKKHRKDYKKWAMESMRNIGSINAMVKTAKSDIRIKDDLANFDREPLLFICGNGVLNLKTGELLPFSPQYKITKATDVDFNPSADQTEWLKFLEVVLKGDKELESFVKRSVGYSMTGQMHEEKFWFLYGPPRTGKTTFLKCITTALGSHASYCPNTVWMKTYTTDQLNTLARYQGTRFIWVGELEASDRIDEPKLKGWVGGDTVTARKLYAEPVDFTPVGKLWLGGNYLPKVSASDSVFCKMFVVPFDNTEILKSLMNKGLKTELLANHLEAILAWCYEGYLEYKTIGLGEAPERVQFATESYKEDVDTIGSFIDELCIKNPEFMVTASKLYNAYRIHVEAQGQRAETQTFFGRELARRGLEKKRSNRGVWYQGITLRDSETTEA